MFEELCDGKQTIVINYLNEFNDKIYGMYKINKIHKKIKNFIYFDQHSAVQKASETLINGRGNNLSKNILLYTILKEYEFKVTLMCSIVEDNTNYLICKLNKRIPWFYIKVDFFGKIITLDCTFEREYMRAACIREIEKNSKEEYIERYYVDNKKLFIVTKNFEVNMEEEIELYEKKYA